MMRQFPVEFSISAGACIWGCLLILLAPLDLVLAIYAATAVHELCHILALRCFRVRIICISLGINGAAIQTSPLPLKQELICAAAGPLGSFLCILLLNFFPLVAFCGLIQGLYNLLPVYPMDGGRILRCLSLLLFPDRSPLICNAATAVTISLIAILGVILYLRTSDRLYLLIAFYFLFQTRASRKIPCKGHQY